MMQNLHSLGSTSSDILICEKERGKTIALHNPDRIVVQKIKVCEHVSDSIAQCDWIFRISQTSVAYYIELKGRDVRHAYEQVFSTLSLTHDHERYKRYICTSVRLT